MKVVASDQCKSELQFLAKRSSIGSNGERGSFFSLFKASYKTVLLIVIVASITVTVSALVAIMLSQSESEVYLPSLGTIKTIDVEVYSDPNGENKIDTLSWDELRIEAPSWDQVETSPQEVTVYVKSISNLKVTLTMSTTDWSPPEIEDYLTLTWDYNGAVLQPGEIIPITLTLSPSSTRDFVYYLVENEVTRFDVAIHFVAIE